MNIFRIGTISKDELLERFVDNEEIILETYSLTLEEEEYLIDVLKRCLEEIGKDDIFEYLRYCFKELIANAKRANAKRIYFEEKKLDLNDQEDYKKGLNEFKKDISEEKHFHSKLFEQKGYYIRVSYKVEDDIFFISIINNVLIHERELVNARKKMEDAKSFSSIEDAFSAVYKDSEGAGLGIIILILMLRKIGLDKNVFNIYTRGNETIATVMLPLSFITSSQNEIINEMIIDELKTIPVFPESMNNLKKKLDNTNTALSEISKFILSDPSILSMILKSANPSVPSTGKRVSAVEAIKLFGRNGIKKILFSYSSYKILEDKTKLKKMKAILEHSKKVAFLAFAIGKNFIPKVYLEDLYVAGALHELGKILLLAFDSELMRKINLVCQQRGIPIYIIEDLTSGYNHSLIGAALSKKWNFPQSYTSAIEFHENPLVCDAKHKNFVYCVFLANIIASDADLYQLYKNIDKSILYFFNIQSFGEFEKWSKKLNQEYNSTKI